MTRLSSYFFGTILVLLLSAGCSWLQQPAPAPAPQAVQPAPENGQKSNPEKGGPAQPGQESVKKPGDYLPLTAGSTWEYQGVGNEYASFTREVLYTSGKSAQLREDTGGTVAAIVAQTSDEAITQVFFQEEAYGTENKLSSPPNRNKVILKSPLAVGTKWPDSDGAREIVAVKASVTSPAGKFTDCLKVKISTPNSTMYEYYQPGVGLVKREFIAGDSKITSTLKKYSIK